MGFDPLKVDDIIKTSDGLFHWSRVESRYE